MTAFAILFSRPVPYAGAAALQERLVEARIANRIPDVALLLEHEPVITLGARARPSHVLLSPDELKARGIALVRSSRGGDVTFHGPGQWVLYPIVKLGERPGTAEPAGGMAGTHLRNLEETAIRTANDFGVRAFRRRKLTGAWTDAGKLAAIGVRFRRWVAFHGMSFNVRPDMAGFQTIVPCGLAGEPVTSLQCLLGERCPAPAAVRDRLLAHWGEICRQTFEVFRDDEEWPARAILDFRFPIFDFLSRRGTSQKHVPRFAGSKIP